MAFKIHYLHCSSETQAEISSVMEQWKNADSSYQVHTSGSTGNPKLITLSSTQLEASARRSNAFFGLNENSRVFMCLSPKTIGGKMMLIRALVGNYAIDITEASGNPETQIQDHIHLNPRPLFYS